MKIYHVIGWGLLTAAACLLPSPAQADSSVMATVGGTPITAAEIEQALRLPLYDLEVEKYRLTRRKLDQIVEDRKSTRLNSSHLVISYAVFCLKKKKSNIERNGQGKKTKLRAIAGELGRDYFSGKVFVGLTQVRRTLYTFATGRGDRQQCVPAH